MILGNIDYINLLPFHIFLKKYKVSSRFKKTADYKGTYPSKINKAFKNGKIDASFISSIAARKKKQSNAGIIGKGKVISVFAMEEYEKELDKESASSNALSKILDTKGKIVIGDKALDIYYNKQEKLTDLSEKWYEITKLPFVFGIFSYNKNDKVYNALIKEFLSQKIHIPYYIQKKYAKRANINIKELNHYLTFIYYKIGYKEQRAIRAFYQKLRKLQL